MIQTIERSEWRGDAFRNDMPEMVGQLEAMPSAGHDLPSTVTMFFDDHGTPVDRLRARAYAGNINPWQLEHIEQLGISAFTLLTKGNDNKVPLGSISTSQLLETGKTGFSPQTLRVAERQHYFPGKAGDDEQRITVDTKRHVFRAGGDGSLKYLGDLGPRVEVKMPDAERTAGILRELGFEDFCHDLPNRSIVPVFTDMLREAVPPHTYEGIPEVEQKYNVPASEAMTRGLGGIIRRFVSRQDDFEPITPEARAMLLFRRFHVANHEGQRLTIVETMAGKLHEKTKGMPETQGGLIIRNTVAPGAFDVDSGDGHENVWEHLDNRGVADVTSYTKAQEKVPFFAADGTVACHIVHDVCKAPDGRELDQVEIEFIGAKDAAPPLDQVTDVMANVGERFRAFTLERGINLEPSVLEKHTFFTVQPVVGQSVQT